jgi:hypothetical protein
MRYTYLACPYSHPDFAVREQRYRDVTECAARLMVSDDLVVYSPISHSHPIAPFMPVQPHGFWMRQCMPFLSHADELLVLRLPGWDKSRGVKEEIMIANLLGIPVNYIDMRIE